MPQTAKLFRNGRRVGHSGPKSLACNNNIGGLKLAGPGEPHPYADGAELLRQRSKWRKNTVVGLSRCSRTRQYDVCCRRRRIYVQRHLHNERLVAGEGSEFGSVVVVDTNTVVLRKVDVQEVCQGANRLVEGFELDRGEATTGRHEKGCRERIDTTVAKLGEVTLQAYDGSGRLSIWPTDLHPLAGR